MKERTKEEFTARFRGVAPHKVARALTALVPGISFSGCSKGHLADVWVSCLTSHGYEKVRHVELDDLEAKIKDFYPK
jgi:hypothetical protein